MIAETKTCRRCGEPIAGGALGGNCPRCLVALAISTNDTTTFIRKLRRDDDSFSPAKFFGDYEILGEIARGGMGIVYRARQVSLNRPVALKMIAAGQLASAAQVQRFALEARAAARLDHPNIVPIYEVGEHQGQHFYSMKLIEGGSLADRIPNRRSPDSRDAQRKNPDVDPPPDAPSSSLLSHPCFDARHAASVIAEIARAVHYAHQRGILHRDLKPTNILLDERDEPHIADFGLAKLMEDDSSLTQSIAVLGTPAYMAPELASGNAAEATTAADIYSLGAIIYELLAGQPPFLAENVPALMRKIVDEEPLPPSAIAGKRTDVEAHGSVVSLLRPPVVQTASGWNSDLDIICLKCLEKEPARRYASAEALADDLDRWLRHEPILARPSTAPEKLYRWCRRQPVLAGLTFSVGFLLVFVAVGALVSSHRIDLARRAEQRQFQIAQQAGRTLTGVNQQLAASVDRLELRLAEDFFHSGDGSSAIAHLAAIVRRDPSNHIGVERLVSALLHRNYPMPAAPSIGLYGQVHRVEFNADGTRLLVLQDDPFRKTRSARVWDARTGQPVTPLLAQTGRMVAACFSPDGMKVATASADHTARLWDARTGQPLTPALPHDGPVSIVRFRPDGSVLLTSDGQRLRLWDLNGAKIFENIVHSTRTVDVSFSADSQFIVTGSDRGSVRVWNARNPAELRAHILLPTNVISVQFSPDAKQVLTVSGDHQAQLWNSQNGDAVGESMRHKGSIEVARFSPDGQRIVTASFDRTAQVWDAHTGRPLGLPLRHNDALTDARFSPDGHLLATGSWDNTAHLWDVATGKPACGRMRLTERVRSVDFSPDGQRLATGAADGVTQVWDIRPSATRELIVKHNDAVTLAVFGRDGKFFATGSDDHTARVWDANTGQALTPPLEHGGKVHKIDLIPDGRWLATASADMQARVWELPGGRLVAAVHHNGEVLSVRFDPASSRIITTSRDSTARVWDVPTGRPLTPPIAHGSPVFDACFSPDGTRILVGSYDRAARVWDARTGQPLSPNLLHGDSIESVRFSPDQTRVATAAHDNTARLWNALTGEPIGAPMRHTRSVFALDFSPDGRRIVTASWDRTARVWDAHTGLALSESMQHDDQLHSAQFSPDGTRIATASLDGTARVWDAATGWPVSEPLRHGGKVFSAQFSPDGRYLLTASADGAARVWYVPDAPTPAPAWLPELAEAVGGLRLDAQRNFAFAGRGSLDEIRNLPAPDPDEFFTRLRTWFFANRADRRPSPETK